MKDHGRTVSPSKWAKCLWVAPLLCLALGSCQDTDFDEYYETPGWLEAPAWDVLASRGDCKTYLSLVEKTLYSKQLEGSGSYTIFVPTDAAFAAFFADGGNPYGYKSVNDIPADVASDMVSYLMLYNAYPCDSLGNVLAGYNTWTRGAAYKHKTPSYDILQRDYVNGDSIWVYDVSSASSSVANEWHNYRYLPVFTENYKAENGLLESDYTHFYPTGSTWSKYGNVLEAQIQEISTGSGDLYCQNGVIHIIDKVVMPLKNLDRMIIEYGEAQRDGDDDSVPDEAKQGAWEALRSFLYHKQGDGNYQFLSYAENTNRRHYFEKMFPTYDLSTFQQRSCTGLPFLLNIEEYSGSVEGDDAYNSGVTLFLPTTQVMNDYINNRIFAYVDDKSDWDAAFNQLSESVLPILWQSILSNGIIWPSHFETAQNTVGGNEFINGGMLRTDFGTVSESSAFASNGLYHVVKAFPRTAAFEGVGSRFLLDSKYSFMERVYKTTYFSTIYSTMLMSPLSNYGQVDITLILTSDANLAAYNGINYDAVAGCFKDSDGADVSTNVNMMARQAYIERDTTDRLDLEVDPLGGAYGGWAFTNTYYGDVIRYKRTGRTVEGKPEIAVQTGWLLANSVNGAPSEDENSLAAMPQSEDAAPETYVAVIKDPSYSGYVNGNVYMVEDGQGPLSYGEVTQSVADYLEWYLRCDSAQAEPRHSLFKEYWEIAKSASTPPAFGSGYFTILVPTDEALQYAIDNGLMREPSYLSRNAVNDATYNDSAANYVNVYLIVTDCFPDDGAANIYAAQTWNLPNQLVDLSGGYPVSSSYKPMTEEWEDFMSGTTRISLRLDKMGADHRLRVLGKDRESGIYVAAKAVNACDLDGVRFSNTVERGLGLSNVIAPKAIIHSFDGFIIYQIQQNPTKHQPATETE